MIGQTVGPYTIVGKLGAGGMGEVYRARDTKLRREVALKVLPASLARDPDRRQRFEREAHLLAALNHPHIAAIYGLEESAGITALVLELVEGVTLADRIAAGPVPVEEALAIARQIAEALEAAHERSIIHRDLKPANVKLTPDGTVKVLDFGLAKVETSIGNLDQSPTITAMATREGIILGTASYMSPEQARGKPVDKHADIWAFGCVLYELLTGVRAFPGGTTTDVLAAVITRDPDWSGLPPETPSAIRRLLARCLDKDLKRRLHDIGDARVEIDDALPARPTSGGRGQLAATEPTSPPTERGPSIAVLTFANMSADKENEYFSDGLAEEIINALAQMPGIKVAGRTSSFFFRGKDVEFGEIGKRLNVDHILEGSVRRAGNRIRVTAQLIKVADGFHLWSERYDREMTDIFAIQDEITQAIAAALRIRLSPDAAALARRMPDLRAYEAYLKARHDCLKATEESLALVEESLDRAIELDPEFALPHSLLGLHYSILASLGLRPAREVIPLARAAEQQALRVEPSLAEAHALLGCWAGTHDHDWNEAERHWRLAMAREPVSHDIRVWYGNHYLLPIGRAPDAVTAMATGLQEDPLNLLYRHHLAVGLRHAGRLEDAEAELRKVLEIGANFPLALGTLGAVCAQQGRFAEALTLTERAYALTPWASPIAGQLAALLMRAGATSRADALIEKLGPGDAYGAPIGLAVFHALSGDLDRAAEWAEKAIEERYPPLVAILGPLLRGSPRWPALASLMNLPA